MYRYCIQCKDKVSGKVGDFVYREDEPFEAISPVFKCLADFYPWMAGKYEHDGVGLTLKLKKL